VKSRIGVNTAANLAGSLATAVIGLAAVPTYLRLLGMEAFGLIGISATIGLILGLADFGLAPTLTRELAREWKTDADIVEGRTVLETLNTVYVPLALALAGIVVIAAPWITHHWLQVKRLSPATVETSIRLIGVTAGCQLLTSFYNGGLAGLQRQVLRNIISVTIVVVQVGGALVLLTRFDIGIVGFFAWQSAVLGTAAIVIGVILFALVPGRGVGRGFQRETLRGVGRFALGMFGISMLSIVVTQADKAVLTKFLELDQFGFYSLAAMIAMSMRRLFGPLFAASYPRFTELVRIGDSMALERIYRLVSQTMSVVVLPASLLVLFYASDVVFVWTGNPEVAGHVRQILAILVGAAALTGVTQTPYAMQLAHGWTRLALLTNAVAAVAFVPALILAGREYGAVGAAWSVFGLNIVYLLVQTPLMHRRLTLGGFSGWALRDTFAPGVFALVPIVALAPLVSAVEGKRLVTGAVLALGGLASTVCALLAARDLRKTVGERLRHGRVKLQDSSC
jgi:O-antigen/teichoic acid export membrane protein